MDVIFNEEYPGDIVVVRYHGYWPNDLDPFFLFDSLAIYERLSYYAGIPPWTEYYYVPSFRFNGEYLKDPGDDDFVTVDDWYAWVRGTIDSLNTLTSPIRINIIDNFQTGDSTVYVTFDVVADDVVPSPLKLHLAVTEWRHRYPYPIGAHDHPFRHFEPDNEGYDLVMNQGDSLRFEWTYPVDAEYRTDRLVTNIFVQDPANRQVLQAARDTVPDIAGIEIVDVGTPSVLGRNVPNPFRSKTEISFSMTVGGTVRLSVYTLTGRFVVDLLDEYAGPGSYSAAWDGRDRFGREVGSGVYYYRLETETASEAGKMILLR
jgi:hypothetical protein